MEVWLLELGKGVGRLFTQPFLYIALLMVWLSSSRRVKSERKEFGSRIINPFAEGRVAWLAGLVISVVAVGLGFMVSYPLLLTGSIVLAVCGLVGRFAGLSAAYTLSATAAIIWTLPFLPEYWPWMGELEGTPIEAIALLTGLLLIVEALEMLKLSPLQTFPERKKGQRGMWIGQHRARRLTVVPFLALFPAGGIENLVEWWPVISINGESFGLILIPFVTGFEFAARGQAPVQAAKAMGRHVFGLALLVLVLAVAGLFVTEVAIAALGTALVGREWASIRHRLREQKSPFFTMDSNGLRILGVIEGTPAAAMGLEPGELIERVNGHRVRTESHFYEALQSTGALNKLEVRDEWGENRYVQRAMFEGDHYELGLVFVEPLRPEESVGFF